MLLNIDNLTTEELEELGIKESQDYMHRYSDLVTDYAIRANELQSSYTETITQIKAELDKRREQDAEKRIERD